MKCSPLLLATGLGAALLPNPAPAQEDPRLSAIEAQIRALQAELQRVRRDLNARDAEVRAARQDAAQARASQAKLAKQPVQPPGSQPSQPLQNTSAAPDNSPASSRTPASTSAANSPGILGGVSFPQGRPTLTSNDGRFSFAVGLQLHYDVGGYFQGSNRPDNRSVMRLNTFGQNLRRARIPFVFKYDDFQSQRHSGLRRLPGRQPDAV